MPSFRALPPSLRPAVPAKAAGSNAQPEQDAVAQVVERGHAVSEVAERLGISTKSLYTWKAQFAKSPRIRSEVAEQAAEIKRLKRELARITEERDILKKAAAYFARGSLWVRRLSRLTALSFPFDPCAECCWCISAGSIRGLKNR